MNLLMLGLGDAGLDDPHSEPVRRHLEYARLAGGRIDLVVDSPAAGVSRFDALTVYRTGTGRLQYPLEAYRMARRLARERMPDLITSQDPFATALVGTWLRGALRRPLLIQNHSSVLFNRHWIADRPALYRILHALARLLLPRADAWRVVNSREQKMYVERLHLPAGRVWCIPVPCDLHGFGESSSNGRAAAVRTRYGLPGSAPVLLWAGRPVRFKRLPVLFDAFARISRVHPDARLVIAGRRALAQEDLAAAERNSGISGAAQWVEVASRAELTEIYGAADVFLFPSVYEGFGRVLVEAGAAGLPAVATATAGAADILLEGDTGFLVPVEDPAAVAGQACTLLADSGLRERMGARARQHIRKAFDPAGLFDAVVAQWRETAAVGVR